MYKAVIIEDEKWVAEYTKNCVDWGELGFEIAACLYDSISAIDEILRLRPDLILTDVHMPQKSGVELIEELMALGYEAQIIVLSGYDRFEYVQRAINAGACGYLLKGFETDDLIRLVSFAKERLDRRPPPLSTAKPSRVAEICARISNADIRQILVYLEQNLHQNLSLETVALHFSFNPSYLSQLFRRETGDTFSSFMMTLRAERACGLLAQGLPVKEVAAACGYGDVFYFYKVFKKATGETVSEYKRRTSEDVEI